MTQYGLKLNGEKFAKNGDSLIFEDGGKLLSLKDVPLKLITEFELSEPSSIREKTNFDFLKAMDFDQHISS